MPPDLNDNWILGTFEKQKFVWLYNYIENPKCVMKTFNSLKLFMLHRMCKPVNRYVLKQRYVCWGCWVYPFCDLKWTSKQQENIFSESFVWKWNLWGLIRENKRNDLRIRDNRIHKSLRIIYKAFSEFTTVNIWTQHRRNKSFWELNVLHKCLIINSLSRLTHRGSQVLHRIAILLWRSIFQSTGIVWLDHISKENI